MAADICNERAKAELESMVSHDLLFRDRSDGPLWEQYEYCPKTQEDEERRKSFFEKDRDWQHIQKEQLNISDTSIKLVPLYDAERNTVYHFNDQTERDIIPDEETQRHDLETSTIPNLKTRDPEHQATVIEVLGRLTPVNKQFGHPGYHEWMTRSLERRVPFLESLESNIPNYGHLCKRCLHILHHSLVLYHLVLMCSIRTHHARTGKPLSFDIKTRYFGPKIEIFTHHGSVRALHASAKKGCHLCCHITKLLGAETLQFRVDSDVPYMLEMRSKRRGYHACLGVPGTGNFMKIHSLSFEHQNWILRKGPSTLKYPRTDIPEVIDQARHWLAECLEKHTERCNRHAQFLPSRIIEVTVSHGSSLSTRLVLGKDLPDDTQYLTLSHCWGGLEMTTLTTENFHHFRANIPVDSLLKTFREAFQTTIWLGYKYIWIDSLCILQDSPQDWEKEAASMGRVYRNSTCTLAATGAENGTQGLFFDRSPLIFTDCPLFIDRIQDRESVNFFAGSDTPIPTPLASRAWVVQEQALSVRTIKFGRDKLTWACRTATCSEGPNERDLCENNHAREFTDLLQGLSASAKVLMIDVLQGASGPFNRKWDDLVGHYTKCNLTKATDRWPAFQGLALEVAEAQHRTLVHGLWSDDLCHQLLWAVLNPSERACDLGKPSWSWLNTPRGIWFPFLKEHMPTAAEACLWIPPSSNADAGGNLKDARSMSSKDNVRKVERTQPATGPKRCQVEASMPSGFILSTSLSRSIDTLRITAFITPCVSKPSEPGNTSYLMQLLDYTQPLDYYDDPLVIEAQWFPDSKPTRLAFLWALHMVDSEPGSSNDYTRGLVLVPVPGLTGYWKRVGRYEAELYNSSHRQSTGKRRNKKPWPWAREKETVFLV